MMLASESTDSVIILAASSTSNMLRSVPQVMLNSNPLAHAIESSRSGLSIAHLAASTALFSPEP